MHDFSATTSNQNWLYCSITAPKSGKRRIKLRASKKPMRQNAMTALRSGVMIAPTARCHAVFATLVGRPVDFVGGGEWRASGKSS